MGLIPIRAQEASSVKAAPGAPAAPSYFARRRGITQSDIGVMTRELATLLRAGLPLDRSFEILISLSPNPKLADLLGRIRNEVRGGTSLSKAIEAQRAPATATGSAALVVVVSAGEPSGPPLRRATVSLQAGELGVPRTAVTDDEGRVAFERLPAGNYVVSAAKPGYVRTFYGSRVPGAGPGLAVALVDGQRLVIRANVLRGGVISGVVRTPGGRPAAYRR
jgi:hypothetical protein